MQGKYGATLGELEIYLQNEKIPGEIQEILDSRLSPQDEAASLFLQKLVQQDNGGVALDASMLDMKTLSGGFYFDIAPQEAAAFKNAKGLSFVIVKE